MKNKSLTKKQIQNIKKKIKLAKKELVKYYNILSNDNEDNLSEEECLLLDRFVTNEPQD